MKAFADLYTALDETTKTGEKVAALERYFAEAVPASAAWTVHFLSGGKLKRLVPLAKLSQWAMEAAEVPEWLFRESYEAVGDLAETIALLLPPAEQQSELPLHDWVENRLLPLRGASEQLQRASLLQAWGELDDRQRFVFNKLITGSFRVGVSQRLVVRALSRHSGLEASVIAHRLMGSWQPSREFFSQLTATDSADADVSQPYPFLLAHPLEADPQTLGPLADWQAEWKWDGIRAQLIRRGGGTYLWSRGEDLMTDRFPEVTEAAERLVDGTVLDGEILGWQNDAALPFAQLQKRIGRKTLSNKILSEVPAVFLAFDCLEHRGKDVRQQPLARRRERLTQLLEPLPPERAIRLSPVVAADEWQALESLREESRARNTEGLMLKRMDSVYSVGRPRGLWWKWKIDPYTVDAVLLYAQRGSGRRASLYTDYTFALWHEGNLVPFAKAYSGLNNDEIGQVDAFVRRNTLERFGPVRSVKPELVFEIAFENIQASTRHKSGVAVRFPRIARWRHDKRSEEADTLDYLKSLVK